MKIEVKNFASYKKLSYEFKNDVVLISGPTGSGKSTICDAVMWVATGSTASNGNADSIRSWYSDENTEGSLHLPDFTITRTRGRVNDLYIKRANGKVERGKDVKETQALINRELNLSRLNYTLGHYSSEFSKSNTFFVADPKERRKTLEEIADLSFCDSLALLTSEKKKIKKDELMSLSIQVEKSETALMIKESQADQEVKKHNSWVKTQHEKQKELSLLAKNFDDIKASEIAAIETKITTFEHNRTKAIDALKIKINKLNLEDELTNLLKLESQLSQSLCAACGAPDKQQELSKVKQKIDKCRYDLQEKNVLHRDAEQLQNQANPHLGVLEVIKSKTNNYADELIRLTQLKPPYDPTASLVEVQKAKDKLSGLRAEYKGIKKEYDKLDRLNRLSADVRGHLVFDSIATLSKLTNELLSKFFDSKLKINLTVADADSVDLSIFVNGIDCPYARLSKGQRYLLKLCFSAALMLKLKGKSRGLNHYFFDEALDGLDPELKNKAYYFFQYLKTRLGGILVIDHTSELKAMFTSVINVELTPSGSVLHEN